MEVVRQYRFLGCKVRERPVGVGDSVKGLNRRKVGIGGPLPDALFRPTHITTDQIIVGQDDNTGEFLLRGGPEGVDPSEYTEIRGKRFHRYEKRIFPGLKMQVVVKP